MDVKVFSAQLKDFDAVNMIVKEGQDEHSKALPHIFKSVEQVMPKSYFTELVEGANTEILIAKIAEEVVGFAVMEIVESPPFDSMVPRKYAYMNDFGVCSPSQRKGVGKILFQACVEWAKSKGMDSLELNVWEFNQKAISFYEQFGMENVSRKMALRIYRG